MKKTAVSILAHVDSGKTTLSEALLYCSGSIPKLGRVDHKNSFLDTFSLERERGITIFSKQAVLKYKDTEFTLLDTPGHVDFSAETERTLQVSDYAILVISATDGVQSHTSTLWKLLKIYNIPCFLFINKMDLPCADKKTILKNLQEKLSQGCVDFSKRDTEEFFECIAENDENLLDNYLNNGYISDIEIKNAIAERKIFPCMFGSALKLDGVEKFLDCLNIFTNEKNYPDNFSARVYKISQDKKGGRLTFLKITGGKLSVREVLPSEKNTQNEKVNQIRIYSGEKYTQIDEAVSGTICAVTGISFARPGDGIGETTQYNVPTLIPVLTYRVIPPQNVDINKLITQIKILEDEDPQLNVIWNERLHEIRVQLMGDIQIEILQKLIAERFGVDVSFGKGNIIYKETITNTVEGVGHFEPLRHYAEVHLIMKSGKNGSGVIIKNECKEDVLDKNWQRLILTHLYEKTHIGVLTGSPVTDIEITLVSGRSHAKHTEGGDFRQATYRAVRQGLRSANSILLEPVYNFTLEIPTENVGKALNDIQCMNGSFNSPETYGDICVITGTAPVSVMCDYSKEVVKYTHGKGKLSCELKGYEPCHNSEDVIKAIGYNPDSDIDNPCDSVFCSHGAGYNVRWNEVKKHMHIAEYLPSDNHSTVTHNKKQLLDMCKNQSDVFALDKELIQIFEQTYGPIKKKSSNSGSRYENRKETYKRPSPKNYNRTEYLLVDGYNVIFSWDNLKKLAKDSIDAAREYLVNILCNYCGYKKCEVILVFDAYKVKGSGREIEKINNIFVVYTKEAETADMYIEKTAHKLARDNSVRVVTSDGLEQLIILGSGALRVSSRAFLEEIRDAEKEINDIITFGSSL